VQLDEQISYSFGQRLREDFVELGSQKLADLLKSIGLRFPGGSVQLPPVVRRIVGHNVYSLKAGKLLPIRIVPKRKILKK
jgi:hypothetical protein